MRGQKGTKTLGLGDKKIISSILSLVGGPITFLIIWALIYSDV